MTSSVYMVRLLYKNVYETAYIVGQQYGIFNENVVLSNAVQQRMYVFSYDHDLDTMTLILNFDLCSEDVPAYHKNEI